MKEGLKLFILQKLCGDLNKLSSFKAARIHCLLNKQFLSQSVDLKQIVK